LGTEGGRGGGAVLPGGQPVFRFRRGGDTGWAECEPAQKKGRGRRKGLRKKVFVSRRGKNRDVGGETGAVSGGTAVSHVGGSRPKKGGKRLGEKKQPQKKDAPEKKKEKSQKRKMNRRYRGTRGWGKEKAELSSEKNKIPWKRKRLKKKRRVVPFCKKGGPALHFWIESTKHNKERKEKNCKKGGE